MSIKHYCLHIEHAGLEQTVRYAMNHGISYIWILPKSSFEVHKNDFPLSETEWSMLPQWLYDEDVERVKGDNILISIHLYRKMEHVRRRVNVIFLKYCRWAWNHENITSDEVYEAVEKLEGALGFNVGGSPAGTGYKHLETLLMSTEGPRDEIGRPAWLRAPQIDLKTTPWGTLPKPLVWHRAPSEEELMRKYLWAFDKNSAYARAAVNERFGIYEPINITGNIVEVGYHDALPGIWLCVLHAPPQPPHDGIDWRKLPPPPAAPGVPTWLSSPLVKLAKKRGYRVELLEGWYFPRYAYVWRGWARDLWERRQACPAGTWQREAYKQMLNDTMGLMNKKRPDWYHQFVGGTYAAMQYNVAAGALGGYYPFGVQIDALYYLSDEPEPSRAVPELLAHPDSLGGYKVKFGLKMTDDVRAILQLPSWTKQLELLNGLAELGGLECSG